MINNWSDLTPDQRFEGLIAFSESDYPPCTNEQFEQWIINFHRERSKREDSKTCHNCFEIEKVWNEPFSGICSQCDRILGCGALNSMET